MNQKGTLKILLIIFVVLSIISFAYLRNKKNTAPVPSTATPSYQRVESGIKNDNELMSVSSNLDNTNIDTSIDTELNQNDVDATSF